MARTSGISSRNANFDRRYFQRFYENPATRVAAADDYRRTAKFIAAYLAVLEISVTSILDLGAGTGRLLRALGRHFPDARRQGVDCSEYACQRYGWRRESVADFRAGRWDLVICHDVLQYLPREDAARALQNLAERCRKALFFTALTREDWLMHCDQGRTDSAVWLRSRGWYVQRLRPDFEALGGGLHLRRGAAAARLALQAPDRGAPAA